MKNAIVLEPAEAEAMQLRFALFRGNRIRRPVAGGAIFWCGLIEDDNFVIHGFCQLVALGAPHVLMRTAQRELRARVVIEQRRLPPGTVVTFNTSSHAVLGELLSVRILVALFALHGRCLEIDIDQLSFQIRGLVALDARRRTMRSQQRESCLRVVESRQLLP